MALSRRLTLIAEDGKIIEVVYPVFAPDRNADEVLAGLRSNAQAGAPLSSHVRPKGPET